MSFAKYALIMALLPVMLVTVSYAGFVGNATIHAPAVILQTNNGTLTIISLNVTTGNGTVTVTGPLSVAQSTLNSSKAAAMVASSTLGKNYKDYNFSYHIFDSGANVSGPSAGTAMTLLALSSLSHKPLLNNFTVTGVINYNGTIGLIGGVYDKIEAAKAHNMKFMMVPFAGNGSLETGIYYLASKYFGIPVIPITNVSEAFSYATGTVPVYGKNVTFNVTDDYNISPVPQAKLSCSNACDQSILRDLSGFTVNFTNASIQNVSKYSGFGSISANLSANLQKASLLSSKGYYYASADVAFIDYIDSFMFQNPNHSISNGLDLLDSIGYYCSSVTPPELTRSNYNNVLNGELRQLWGNVTINALIENYNATAIDSDGVLRNVYSAGEAYAWCRAASEIYSKSSPQSGVQIVNVSPSINTLAESSVSNALSATTSSVPSVYLISAKLALDQHEYALALLDSDYIATDEHGIPAMSNAGLYNATASMINGSRFGSWATQFADEALFYMNESEYLPNSSNSMLSDGYYAALLGNKISNSTKEIYSMLTSKPVSTVTTTPTSVTDYITPATINIIIVMLIIIIALLLATLFIVYMVLSLVKKELFESGNRNKKRRV